MGIFQRVLVDSHTSVMEMSRLECLLPSWYRMVCTVGRTNMRRQHRSLTHDDLMGGEEERSGEDCRCYAGSSAFAVEPSIQSHGCYHGACWTEAYRTISLDLSPSSDHQSKARSARNRLRKISPSTPIPGGDGGCLPSRPTKRVDDVRSPPPFSDRSWLSHWKLPMNLSY